MLVMALSFFLLGVTGIIVTYAMFRDKNLEHAHHVSISIILLSFYELLR